MDLSETVLRKCEKELPMPELVIGVRKTESLIGNGFRPQGVLHVAVLTTATAL